MVGYVPTPTERKGMHSDIGWLRLPARRAGAETAVAPPPADDAVPAQDDDRNVHGSRT